MCKLMIAPPLYQHDSLPNQHFFSELGSPLRNAILFVCGNEIIPYLR